MTAVTQFDLVVFDMAGTTVADPGNVTESFLNAFRQFGMNIPPSSAARVMGYRKKEAIQMLLEEMNGSKGQELFEQGDKIHDAFIRSMIHHYETGRSLKPLPGAEEVFELLHRSGIKVALNTGFSKAVTQVILRRLGWDANPYISAVISSDEVSNARPHAEMIHTLMERLHISSADAVAKVGDTSVDVEEGRNAGCSLVAAVTTGAFTREQLQAFHPDAVIDSLEELLPLLNVSTPAA